MRYLAILVAALSLGACGSDSSGVRKYDKAVTYTTVTTPDGRLIECFITYASNGISCNWNKGNR